MDDEPLEIDTGDLPTEDEFAATERAAGAAAGTETGLASPAMAAQQRPDSIFGFIQLWATLVGILYIVAGLGVGAIFAFSGAARAGWTALRHPEFYLLMLFWPIALWQLVFGQF